MKLSENQAREFRRRVRWFISRTEARDPNLAGEWRDLEEYVEAIATEAENLRVRKSSLKDIVDTEIRQ